MPVAIVGQVSFAGGLRGSPDLWAICLVQLTNSGGHREKATDIMASHHWPCHAMSYLVLSGWIRMRLEMHHVIMWSWIHRQKEFTTTIGDLLQLWPPNGQDADVVDAKLPRVAFFANRNIAAGEDLGMWCGARGFDVRWCSSDFHCWLVVWNMTFIFPYIWNNHPSWLIFFRGVQTTN